MMYRLSKIVKLGAICLVAFVVCNHLDFELIGIESAAANSRPATARSPPPTAKSPPPTAKSPPPTAKSPPAAAKSPQQTHSQVDNHPNNKGVAGKDFLPKHLQNVDQHNEELIKYIKDHWVFPPSSKPLTLENMTAVHYSQVGQSAYVDSLLGKKTNGHFIECGAFDGEHASNSLFFERQRNWTGILIEGNPEVFKTLMSKNRHSYAVNACLSPKNTPAVVNFSMAPVLGGMTDYKVKGLKVAHTSTIAIQCLPLYSIMKATGMEHIDYFSLDVEGAEADILRTIPFHEVDIDLIGAERLFVTDMLGTYNYSIVRKATSSFYDTFLQKSSPKKLKN